MAKFPEFSDIAFPAPIVQEIQYKTMVSKFNRLGVEKRRRKWLYPRRAVSINYPNATWADARTLWQFYMARTGMFNAFAFFFRTADSYEGEYVGEGDGSTTVFNLPFKSGGSISIYRAGSLLTVTTEYVITSAGGTDGEDKITFVTAPSDGLVITADFAGLLKIRCRFAQDVYSMQMFYGLLVTTGINLQGVLNA